MTESEQPMKRLVQLPDLQWKWLICLFCLATALLIAHDAWYALRALVINNAHGTVGLRLNDHIDLYPDNYGSYVLTVKDVDHAAGTPLSDAQPGAQLRFANPLDRGRRFQAGDEITLIPYWRTPAEASSSSLTNRSICSSNVDLRSNWAVVLHLQWGLRWDSNACFC